MKSIWAFNFWGIFSRLFSQVSVLKLALVEINGCCMMFSKLFNGVNLGSRKAMVSLFPVIDLGMVWFFLNISVVGPGQT